MFSPTQRPKGAQTPSNCHISPNCWQNISMTGFSLDSAAGNETLLLILDVYFAQAFVTGHCHLIRCSEIYHNFYQLSQSVKLAK